MNKTKKRQGLDHLKRKDDHVLPLTVEKTNIKMKEAGNGPLKNCQWLKPNSGTVFCKQQPSWQLCHNHCSLKHCFCFRPLPPVLDRHRLPQRWRRLDLLSSKPLRSRLQKRSGKLDPTHNFFRVALWLATPSQVNSFNQSQCSISVYCSFD